MADSTSDSSPPPPQRRVRAIGGYEIEGELGRGGMGVVYLAHQRKLNRRVALKMLTGHYGADELKRFLDEAETAAGLQHNNIAHIYEVGEQDGAPFYSLEYVEAGSLADRLRKGPIEPREAAQLLIQVARALHFAHQNGVVHRDMKPGNVLLDADGVPKVADFGIAKRLKEDTHLTVSGAVIGTPTYMAPEQAKGSSRHVGPPADIYSLGAILYEMLAGRPPFLPEESETAITVRVLTEDPVSPAWHQPEIPRDLEVICMKCLEKQPRDRYQSAAALAEDLRRYQDDETIVARPPTTAVRTVKWVRRHPWKFVGATVGLLLAVAGLTRLAQWELYQRLHLEYATRVDWVRGGLEPVTKLSRDHVAHCAVYLRLTRRGRLGPIIKAETLNARGNPAVLRRLFIDEMIPIYIEGVAKAQPYSEKTGENTTVDFVFDGRNAIEATSRNRIGSVNWRILYDRQVASDSSNRTAGARFVNIRGFDAINLNGASHMEFERDAQGRDLQVTFFNAAGRPAANGEGVYGYKMERDEMGRGVRLVNLGRDGQPAPNRLDQIAYTAKWGKGFRRGELRNGKGQPAVWNGISAVLTELDEAGNPIRISQLAPDGKLARAAATEWSIEEMKRNERGELIQSSFFKADSNNKLRQVSQIRVSYDGFGHPSDIEFKGQTPWRSALRYDQNGNVLEEKYLNSKGKPVANDKGYAIRRFDYTSTSQGTGTEETYFDPAGKKTYNTAGYHRLITEFDPTGMLRRQSLDEHDPAHYKYYRYVSEPEYDAQMRIRHSVDRFEQADGKLATNADLLYTSSEYFYDEKGRVTSEWKMGCDPKEWGGGTVIHIESEWHSTGTEKRWFRQICDQNRKALPFITNGAAARHEEEFDAIGQRERIYESGFDEKLVGFFTREAKYAGGKLQSVTHTRRDGTVLASVRVVITSVQPQQPKAAELQVGDQLVAANDKPVTTAYAWVEAETFPGGWIEVLRNGQRVRIDGFQEGPLGITIEDRAP